MNPPVCGACSASLDTDDNFCRHCGAPVGPASLPAVRPSASAIVWQPRVSPVVKGAAVMAAGTVGQYVVRRLVSNLLSGGARPRRGSEIQLRAPRERDGMVDEAQVITEMVTMRRVRIRRPA